MPKTIKSITLIVLIFILGVFFISLNKNTDYNTEHLIGNKLNKIKFESLEHKKIFTEEDFKGKTDFSLNIEIENKQRDENQILVSLIVNLEAKINQKTAFILEMTYCGLFKFPDVTEDILEKQIKVECPKMLFPYIRRLISQTMIESGMPNIDIKNINFFDLYKAKKKN